MPHLKVRFFIRGYMLGTFVSFDRILKLADTTTLLAALVEVERRYGVETERAIEESEVIRESILLNGERVAMNEIATATLHDGDQVTLLSPLAGG